MSAAGGYEPILHQPGLSVGMKLAELAEFMKELGCTDAMNLDGGKMTEKTRYHSAIFNSSTDKPEPVYPGIRDLKTGDIVRIDGNFKTLQKTIDIDSYNDLSRSKNVLDNPEFRVEITAVEEI